jgi:hypothetical protein
MASDDQRTPPAIPGALTPEQLERLREEMIGRKELYTNAALLAHVGADAEEGTRQSPVKSKSGLWLKPGDPDYEAARVAALTMEISISLFELNQQQDMPKNTDDDKTANEKDARKDEKTHDDARVKFDRIEERRARFQEGFAQVASVAQAGVTGRNNELLARDAAKRIEREVGKRVRTGGNSADLKDIRRKIASANSFSLPDMQDADAQTPGSGNTKKTVASARERKRSRNQGLNDLARKQKGLDIT